MTTNASCIHDNQDINQSQRDNLIPSKDKTWLEWTVTKLLPRQQATWQLLPTSFQIISFITPIYIYCQNCCLLEKGKTFTLWRTVFFSLNYCSRFRLAANNFLHPCSQGFYLRLLVGRPGNEVGFSTLGGNIYENSISIHSVFLTYTF